MKGWTFQSRRWLSALIASALLAGSLLFFGQPQADAAFTVPKNSYDGLTTYSYAVSKSIPTAKPLLSVNLGAPSQTFDEMGRSLISGSVIYYVKGGALRAVNVRTNKQLWTAGNQFRAPLFFKDNYLLVSTRDNVLFRIDARTGRTVWSFRYMLNTMTNDMMNSSFSHKVEVSGDTVLLSFLDSLVALQLRTGKSIWRWNSPGSRIEELYVRNGLVLVPSTFRTGTPATFYYAFDLKTGKQRWMLIGSHGPLQEQVGNRIYMEDLSVSPGITKHELNLDVVDVTNGKLLATRKYLPIKAGADPKTSGAQKISMKGNDFFIQSNDGHIYRFDVRNEPPKSPKPLTKILNWIAGPYDNKLYFLNNGGDGVSAFKLADGTTFRYTGLDNPVSKLLLDRTGLYIAQTDGEMFAINIRTGKTLFRFQAPTQRFASIQVSGNVLLFESEDQVYLFAIPSELQQPVQ